MACQTTLSSSGAPSPTASPNSTLSLQVTALVGQSNQTVFQCWKIQPDFQSGTGGTKIQQLGDISGALLVTFSSTNVTIVGVRPAPTPQYVLSTHYLMSVFNCVNRLLVVLSGSGYVKLPSTGQYLGVVRGNILILNDTSAVSAGHDTVWYPGAVVIQLPFAQNLVNHTVLYNGPCNS